MKKRIALVANSTWNIYNFRQNIIQKLLLEGHDVYVLAPIDEYIEYIEQYPTVRHIGLRSLKRDSTNPLRDLLLILELRRKYKNLKLDLVLHYTHKPNIFGTISAKILGIPNISFITGLGYSFIHEGWVQQITKALYKITKSWRNKIIFENKDDKDFFIKQGLCNENEAVAVPGCGVDIEYYKPIANGQPHKDITFTFIGRLLKDKGVREFANAAESIKRQYHSAKFVMLGDFDEENPSTIDREDLLSWINKEVVDYKGFVRDVRPYIAKSDVIVLPSYREGLPRIVIEGMAMSKPIITTNTAGCRETVEEGVNGYLVETRNTDDLAKGMITMINKTDEERHLMGEKGRQMAEDILSTSIVSSKIYDVIKSLI